MAIPKVNYDFEKWAIKYNQKLMSVPLKDKSTAKILWNDNSVDCYIMKNNTLVAGGGVSGNKTYVKNSLAHYLDNIRKVAEPGFDMLTAFVKASVPNMR